MVFVRGVARGRLRGDKSGAMTTAFQPSLFGAEEASFDASFADLRRINLDARSWVDVAPGWVRGAGSDDWDPFVALVLSRVPPHPKANRLLARIPY